MAPPGLVPALTAARRLADWHGELTTQLAMTEFIERGRLVWQLRRVRGVYAARHARLVGAASESRWVPGSTCCRRAPACTCARVVRPGLALDLGAVAARAAARGIRVERLARYRALPGVDGLVLGYGRVLEERIEEGVRRIWPGSSGRSSGVAMAR